MFEGRPLARPAEDLEDQGLGFDLGTLMGRCGVLRMFGVGAAVGAAAVGLAACSPSDAASPSPSSTAAGSTAAGSTAAGSTAAGSTAAGSTAAAGEIPEETAGPYPGDGSNGPDVLQQSGIVRSDIRSSFGTGSGTAAGVPMTLELTVQDLANGGAPFAGTAVYVWHCDREGRYSMYSQGVTGENYLRGVQIADAAGRVRFTSIFPACYAGRWPHVHFEVYAAETDITDATKAIATSQVALPRDTCTTVYRQAGYDTSVANLARVSLDTDNVFGDDSGASQLGTVTGDVAGGYTVSLAVRVDTRTAAGGGGSAPGGGGPGSP
jgi:protocatechuate 3,4-dioxygenase beta subunit